MAALAAGPDGSVAATVSRVCRVRPTWVRSGERWEGDDDRGGSGGRFRDLVALTDLTSDLNELAHSSLTPHVSSNRLIQMLVQIALWPDVTPAALSAAMGISRSLTSQLLRRLLDEKLVRRSPVADDHRSVQLSLTARGRSRVGSFETSVVDYFQLNRTTIDATVRSLGADPDAVSPPPSSSVLATVVALVATSDRFASWASSVFGELGLGVNERYALSLIVGTGPCQPAELSQRLRLTSGAVSAIVDRLVAAGLARRNADPGRADRRAVLVEPTASGLALTDELADALAGHARTIGVALGGVAVASRAAEPVLAGSPPGC